MSILDIFKKKKEKKAEKKETVIVEKTVQEVRKPAREKKTTAGIYEQIRKPHISEKATSLSESNQYVFEVYPNASKHEVKKAVESLYNVDVSSVNIINIHRKQRRLGRSVGFKKGYKKAIVKIKAGQKIEII